MSKGLKNNPRLTATGPLVIWYGKGGRCKPGKALFFTVTPPGSRTSYRVEIPAAYRRSVAAREAFVLNWLRAFARQLNKKRKEAEEKKREKEKAKKKYDTQRTRKRVKPPQPIKKIFTQSKIKTKKIEHPKIKLAPKKVKAKRLTPKEKKLQAENEKLKKALAENEKLKRQLEEEKKKKAPPLPKKPPKKVPSKPPKQKKIKEEITKTLLEEYQDEVLRKEGIFERPIMCPTLDDITQKNFRISSKEDKTVVGRSTKKRNQKKLEELQRKWQKEGVSRYEIKKRLEDKEETGRIGVNTYSQKRIDLKKMHVDFHKDKPVQIFQEAANSIALTLREYFKPFAEQFLDECRGKTEESYILRVKTLNWLPGVTEPREEGIGTERTTVSTFIPKNQIDNYRKTYPKLNDDQILRIIQVAQLEGMLKDLFEYFIDRYEQYLGRKMIQSLAVTGFSMEVVERVVEEQVER